MLPYDEGFKIASQLEVYFVEVFEIEAGGFQTGQASNRNGDCDLVCVPALVCDSLMAS